MSAAGDTGVRRVQLWHLHVRAVHVPAPVHRRHAEHGQAYEGQGAVRMRGIAGCEWQRVPKLKETLGRGLYNTQVVL